MAKRRAEDTLLRNSPSKRCCTSLCSVDVPMGAPLGPPSILALLGSRSRKRPHYFEGQEEAALYRKPPRTDSKAHEANVEKTPRNVQDRHSSAPASSKKRSREDSVGSETVILKDKADDDTNTEDCTYNSFQYWRTPLPELDLSLLEDARDQSETQDKIKVKGSSSDAMET